MLGQRIPTNQAKFLGRLNHKINLALGAFDAVEFGSFDFAGA